MSTCGDCGGALESQVQLYCYACDDSRDAKAREIAGGHTYRGPGYCRTCGVREDMHSV